MAAGLLAASGDQSSPGADPAYRSSATPPRPRVVRTPKPIALPPDLPVPRYAQGPEPFRDGETLVYAARWEGVPAAEARIVIAHNRTHPGWWTGQMWINTSRVVDPLYRMRDYFRENFDYKSWRPEEIRVLQHEKSRQDQWLATFDQTHRTVTAVKTNHEGRTWVRRFIGGEPWGPFSGGMIALSQPLTPGKSYTFDLFSGGNRYVFAFAVQGRERITTGLGAFDTLRIEPSVIWLSQGSFRSQASEMKVWVTDDQRHLPVQIESAVYFGSVRADLTQIIEPPATPANVLDDPRK
jgi:hypothetical protein